MNQKTKSKADQSARFIEAAKNTGADESGKTFEKAFKKIASPQARMKAKKKSRL